LINLFYFYFPFPPLKPRSWIAPTKTRYNNLRKERLAEPQTYIQKRKKKVVIKIFKGTWKGYIPCTKII